MNKATQDIDGNKSSRRIGFFALIFPAILLATAVVIAAFFKVIPEENHELILSILKMMFISGLVMGGWIAVDQVRKGFSLKSKKSFELPMVESTVELKSELKPNNERGEECRE